MKPTIRESRFSATINPKLPIPGGVSKPLWSFGLDFPSSPSQGALDPVRPPEVGDARQQGLRHPTWPPEPAVAVCLPASWACRSRASPLPPSLSVPSYPRTFPLGLWAPSGSRPPLLGDGAGPDREGGRSLFRGLAICSLPSTLDFPLRVFAHPSRLSPDVGCMCTVRWALGT